LDLNLTGRTALITGGSKGIGLAIAHTLAAEGCNLHLAARTASELDRVADDIRTRHTVTVSCHPADLSDSAQMKTVAAACRHVDILVNSAGGIPRGTLLDIDEERGGGPGTSRCSAASISRAKSTDPCAKSGPGGNREAHPRYGATRHISAGVR
jgi:NAD(P)-dependent dehydrogenase (short-subunit alcohol dehydrogenase family)